jgi:hypothetical protein
MILLVVRISILDWQYNEEKCSRTHNRRKKIDKKKKKESIARWQDDDQKSFFLFSSGKVHRYQPQLVRTA